MSVSWSLRPSCGEVCVCGQSNAGICCLIDILKGVQAPSEVPQECSWKKEPQIQGTETQENIKERANTEHLLRGKKLNQDKYGRVVVRTRKPECFPLSVVRTGPEWNQCLLWGKEGTVQSVVCRTASRLCILPFSLICSVNLLLRKGVPGSVKREAGQWRSVGEDPSDAWRLHLSLPSTLVGTQP